MSQDALTRRDFLKTSATGATIAALAATGNYAYAQGSDKIRIGLVGCGGRGTGAAGDSAKSTPGVEIVAMGDLFKDRLENSRKQLQSLGAQYKVTDETAFVGFDAYKKVLAQPIDLVILATPPGFRPIHFRAAVEAGKHVFLEKPVAVDATGARSIIETGEMARQKKLAVVCGTQRRHQAGYIETMKRLHDGQIGEILSAECYWNQGGLWMHPRQPEWSDMEWQVRNWLYFTWLSGDHITEQHVHNLDVVNWAMGGPPAKAYGMGGRQVRTDPAYGNIYDHFTIQYDYPNGARVLSMCRQQDGTIGRVEEHFAGTKGRAETRPGRYRTSGANAWRWDGKEVNPYVQEHADMIASIRSGELLNEAKRIAESTLTAIMGRMSAYTGQEVTWEQIMNSKLDLSPAKYELGALPVPPVAVPGKTQMV